MLVQVVRDLLIKELSEEDRVAANIKYLLYGDQSIHRAAVSGVSSSLVILPDANDPTSMTLDADIKAFQLKDLSIVAHSKEIGN